MPPFSIAEFADLVSSALALDDDIQMRFGQRWDDPNGEASFVCDSALSLALDPALCIMVDSF